MQTETRNKKDNKHKEIQYFAEKVSINFNSNFFYSIFFQ